MTGAITGIAKSRGIHDRWVDVAQMNVRVLVLRYRSPQPAMIDSSNLVKVTRVTRLTRNTCGQLHAVP
jgi:hypothetical protein